MNMRKLLLSTLLVTFLVAPGCGSGGGDFVDGIYTGPTAPAPLSDPETLTFALWDGEYSVDDPVFLLNEAMWFAGGGFDKPGSSPASRGTDRGALLASVFERINALAADHKAVVSEPINQAFPHPIDSAYGWFSIVGTRRDTEVSDEGTQYSESGWTTEVTVTFRNFYLAEDLVLDGILLLTGSYKEINSAGDYQQPMSFSCHADSLRVFLPEGLQPEGPPPVEQFAAKESGGSYFWFPWEPFGNGVVYGGGFRVFSSYSDVYRGGQWWEIYEDVVDADATISGETGSQVRIVGHWTATEAFPDEGDEIVLASADGTIFSDDLGGSVRFSLHEWDYDVVDGDGYFVFDLAGDRWTVRLRMLDRDRLVVDAEIDSDGDGEFDGEFSLDGPWFDILPFFWSFHLPDFWSFDLPE